jgi:hypothetical protein
MKKRPVFLIVLIIMLFFVSAVQPAFALEKWPGVTNMLNMALAAGSFLVYTIVWQVNNSVNGLVGDAHAVYEAIKEDVTPKITDWWNGLSVEDQQAFTDKVQSDEDLMVSEVIPQDIITDIVSQSIGYTGNELNNIGDVYDYGMGNYDLEEFKYTSDQNDFIQASAYNVRTHNKRSKMKLIEHKFYDVLSDTYIELTGWYYIKDDYDNHDYYIPLDWSEELTYQTLTTKYDSITSDYSVQNRIEVYPTVKEGYVNQYNVATTMYSVPVPIEYNANYNPDDQQLAPFYYPVDALNMADVWDVGTVSDSDLTADTAIYNAVEAETWDVSAGVAESAIAVGLQGDVLVDNDSGLPFALGVVKPWEHTATETTTETETDTDIDIDSETIDWSPIRDLGQLLTDKFPFCLPFDVYDLFSNFVIDSPSAPSWTWNFDGNDVVIDLNYLDPLMDKVRPIELAVMSIGFYWLVFKTLSS